MKHYFQFFFMLLALVIGMFGFMGLYWLVWVEFVSNNFNGLLGAVMFIAPLTIILVAIGAGGIYFDWKEDYE